MTTGKFFDEYEAYNAGFDAGTNGSNTDNTHYSYFANHALSREWERGYNEALFGCPKPATRRSAVIIKIDKNGDESFHE